jgi:hypothetical protein
MIVVMAVVATLVVTASAGAQQIRGQQIGAQRQGPIAKLVELERRKNEWLRQRFLGR